MTKKSLFITQIIFLILFFIGTLFSCDIINDQIYKCVYCKDTGICSTCKGTGIREVPLGSGPSSIVNKTKCYDCYPWGSGRCGYCGGSGLLE